MSEIKLPEHIAKYFQSQPESGMGYQTVVNGEHLLVTPPKKGASTATPVKKSEAYMLGQLVARS